MDMRHFGFKHSNAHRVLNWHDIVQSVIEEFGQDEFDGQMTKLCQLKQTGTIAEYRQAFEECMYYLISLDENLSTRWFVTQFVFGLREDILLAVRLQGPTSISRAASLACIHEEETETHHPRAKPAAPTKPPTGVVAMPSSPAPARTDWPRKQGADDFNRVRQL
jgi:hypothetical protein